MLSSPDDCNSLKEILVNNGNIVEFREYNVGHIGILCPKDESISEDILHSVLQYNS